MKGYTILEVLLVVAIVGVLAAVGVPSYVSYMPRSQASEAMTLLSASRHAALEYRANAGKWPQAIEEIMQSTTGKYTASVAVYPDSDPSVFALVARMSALGTAAEIRGATLLLRTSDDGGSWSCAAGGDNPIKADYLPASCR